MPHSPSRRRSPSRESAHRRVNDFGNALPAKPKDDELTLFADMQKTEIENFLLEPSEDFDESICNAHRYPPPLYNNMVLFLFSLYLFVYFYFCNVLFPCVY